VTRAQPPHELAHALARPTSARRLRRASFVSDVERGRRNIGFMNLERLAGALEVDMSELMTKYEATR
jgi:transcriptional regulator with XRE-family HTH domain